MTIRATYKGDGFAFHAGIPARNLEQEEYAALTNEERALLRESPLYDVLTDAEYRAKKQEGDPEPEAEDVEPTPEPTPEPEPEPAPEPAPTS
jgi:outer membrane biosynthesis protein TonB